MGKTCSCMPHLDLLILILLVIFFLYIVFDFKETFENEGNGHVEIDVVTNENTFSVTNDSRNYTLSRSCPHAGCNVNWKPEQKKFVCPCHASKFDINGTRLEGPAQNNLEVL